MLPAFSLSIIIDSRVNIIDYERPGASPCDSRGRLHANNTKSIVLYSIRLYIACSYFTFSLGFFHFLLLADASDKAYQLLAHGRWFSPASSTTTTGRHDIAEILLKVALSSSNNKTLNARLLARVITGSHYT